QIAIIVADFSEVEADMLRKAMGKKLPEVMAKTEKLFMEKAVAAGKVDEETARLIFDNVRTAQRYSFNKCLTPDAVVELEGGTTKTISECKIGDRILAPSDNDRDDMFTEILDVINTGDKPVFEITLESGKQITSSIDHQHVCEDGEKRPLWQIISE